MLMRVWILLDHDIRVSFYVCRFANLVFAKKNFVVSAKLNIDIDFIVKSE